MIVSKVTPVVFETIPNTGAAIVGQVLGLQLGVEVVQLL